MMSIVLKTDTHGVLVMFAFKGVQVTVQHGSGNGPFKIHIFVIHLSFKFFEDNLNQNYGIWIDFNYIASKDVNVVALFYVIWACSHSMKLPISFCVETSLRCEE